MAPIRNTANKGKAIAIDDVELTPAVPNKSAGHDSLKSNQHGIWQEAIDHEVRKTKSMEKELNYFKKVCGNYANRALRMEGLLWRMEAAEECGGDAAHGGKAEEEVQSGFNLCRRYEIDGKCSRCRSRVANVVLMPCRHLCFCSECDNQRDACLLCNTERNGSVRVILDPKKSSTTYLE